MKEEAIEKWEAHLRWFLEMAEALPYPGEQTSNLHKFAIIHAMTLQFVLSGGLPEDWPLR